MGIKAARFVCTANWGEDNENVLCRLASVDQRRDSHRTGHQPFQDPPYGWGGDHNPGIRQSADLYGRLDIIRIWNVLFQAAVPND